MTPTHAKRKRRKIEDTIVDFASAMKDQHAADNAIIKKVIEDQHATDNAKEKPDKIERHFTYLADYCRRRLRNATPELEDRFFDETYDSIRAFFRDTAPKPSGSGNIGAPGPADIAGASTSWQPSPAQPLFPWHPPAVQPSMAVQHHPLGSWPTPPATGSNLSWRPASTVGLPPYHSGLAATGPTYHTPTPPVIPTTSPQPAPTPEWAVDSFNSTQERPVDLDTSLNSTQEKRYLNLDNQP